SKTMFLGVPLISSVVASVGVSNGLAQPKIVKHTLRFPNLPQALVGLKIAHLTDIHVATLTTRDWMESFVERVNAEKADLICITGDLADGLPSYFAAPKGRREELVQYLGRLQAPLGVYACTGNHEYYSDYSAWMRIYTQLGIHFLHNKAICLSFQKGKFLLAGLDDKQSKVRGVLSSVYAGQPDCFRILMDHRPESARENAQAKTDLQLSGHTHGGHCLGMDYLVARANKSFVRGLYRVQDMQLYVSSGCGLWCGFPVRLGVDAEIAFLTLS
ncbi:MAG: metallophosphoesterase, partial [Desulfovibrio sp.]|nr:metallophosphoesterase [Desulfovibrio sp.]